MNRPIAQVLIYQHSQCYHSLWCQKYEFYLFEIVRSVRMHYGPRHQTQWIIQNFMAQYPIFIILDETSVENCEIIFRGTSRLNFGKRFSLQVNMNIQKFFSVKFMIHFFRVNSNLGKHTNCSVSKSQCGMSKLDYRNFILTLGKILATHSE